MEVFVARQPIFDRKQRVYGYELLFRSGLENAFQSPDGDQATSQVITNSLLLFGGEAMTRGKRAFINFSREFLLGGYASLLPREWVVVEVLETVAPEPLVLEACQKLAEKGYLLALDDFEYRSEYDPLIKLAAIVKLDFLALQGDPLDRQVRKLKEFGVPLLAEKVETQADYQRALDMGFSYFQGYFFSKPVIVAGKDVPGFKLAYLDMLSQINRPDLDFPGMEQVIKRDVSLSYKLLRYINSAYFSLRSPVNSLQQALNLLGEDNIRKWASLVALAHLGQDKPDELVASSLVRAKLSESLASQAGLKGRESDLFLMGLFSLLEPLVGRPLAEIIEGIPVHQEVKQALLGQSNRLAQVFALIQAYERGEWPECIQLSQALGLDEIALPQHYLEALQWANLLEAA